MIERIDTGQRMSKIVRHNGVAYLCGQVGDGATVAEQTRDCLARVEALLTKAGSSRQQMRSRGCVETHWVLLGAGARLASCEFATPGQVWRVIGLRSAVSALSRYVLRRILS
jgi:hypothetical protein